MGFFQTAECLFLSLEQIIVALMSFSVGRLMTRWRSPSIRCLS